MSAISRVIIGIQARSTSSRLPNKAAKPLGNGTVLSGVIDSCWGATQYLNRHSNTKMRKVSACLCIPYGDSIKRDYEGQIDIVEGPEDDVLSRYMNLLEQKTPDYIVRVTGDCPLLPQFVISKAIMVATMNGYDYVSNVDPRFRTVPDGWDCEVISSKLLAYAHANAKEAFDREHVTTYVRAHMPDWATSAALVGPIDLSHIKISVDNEDDLVHAQDEEKKVLEKRRAAEKLGVRVHAY